MCSRCRCGFSGQESRRAKEGPAKGSRGAAAETVLVSKRPSMLKLFYTNASSFLNKIYELRISVKIYEPDIICITESHLNSAIDNNELSIDNYTIFQQDRNFKIKQVTQDALYSADGVDSSDISVSGGGGSLIYVKNYLRVEPIDHFKADCHFGVLKKH